MKNSLLFSPMEVDALNNYIKEKINHNLYLFAYYNPKKYTAEINASAPELNFIKAVLNLYALYKDCSSFLMYGTKTDCDLLMLLEKYGYLSTDEKKTIINFLLTITSFRMLFAHNMHQNDSNNVKDMQNVKYFINLHIGSCTEILGYNEINLSTSDWQELLEQLKISAENTMRILKDSISKIPHSEKETDVISEWKQLILDSYKKQLKKFLFTALKNSLKIYSLTNNIKTTNDTNVIKEYYEEVENKCKKIMEDSNIIFKCQITPIEFFGEILKLIEIEKYWKNYYSST